MPASANQVKKGPKYILITYRKLSLATKRVVAAGVLALSAGAGAGVIVGATSTASAAPRSIKLIGTFASHPDRAGCTSATGACIAGHFEGLLNGTAGLSVNSFAPTACPGVALADATLVIHDIHGDINCEEEATLNTAPGSDSEFGFVCEVTSGTGRYAGATGHVDAFGSMSPGATDWTGTFSGGSPSPTEPTPPLGSTAPLPHGRGHFPNPIRAQAERSIPCAFSTFRSVAPIGGQATRGTAS